MASSNGPDESQFDGVHWLPSTIDPTSDDCFRRAAKRLLGPPVPVGQMTNTTSVLSRVKEVSTKSRCCGTARQDQARQSTDGDIASIRLSSSSLPETLLCLGQ